MLKICALNESSSETDSDNEQVQAETREAQEAGLLDLYSSGLKLMMENKKVAAREVFVRITQSAMFTSGEGSEQIQRTLRYNVHKNLGECFMEEENWAEAEDHFFLATQIDRTDVTLWWQLASASVKLGNFCNVRGALEEGLACSPTHWPCLENLIVVNFKLCDNYACLCYCAQALERDPGNKKAIEYKSKVYLEMPFMQEYMKDMDFVPIPVEWETYDCPPPKPEPRPRLFGQIESLTLSGLGEMLLKLYNDTEGEAILNCVDSAKILDDFHERARLREEAKIHVSVQNLCEEMIDIVESCESERLEEVTDICDRVLDELVCDIFGVAPLSEDERAVRQILNEIIGDSVEKANVRKKSVILPAKTRKKHFSIFDEIPDELLEKRRSCRQNVSSGLASSNDNSIDTSGGSSGFAQRQLLSSFLPDTLKASVVDSPDQVKSETKNVKQEDRSGVVKNLFSDTPWLTEEEERQVVTQFLTDEDKTGLSVDLMRFFLDTLGQLEVGGRQRRLPSDLVRLVASLYPAWRSHWGYQLEYTRPQEPLTQASLGYYILGNEAIVADLQAREEPMSDRVKTQMWADLLELDTIYFELPLNTQVRVRSLRFHYFSLIHDEEELGWEIKTIEEFYDIWEGEELPILEHHPVTGYKIVSSSFLTTYKTDLKKTRELEELQEYYNAEKFREIVDLLAETLDRDARQTVVTPSKEAGKTPDRESQIDIYIESLYHCQEYERCLKWLEEAFNAEYFKITDRVAQAKAAPAPSEESAEQPNPAPGDNGQTKDPPAAGGAAADKDNASINKNSKVILKTEWDILDSYLSLMLSCLDGLNSSGKTSEAVKFGGHISLSSAARLTQNLLSIVLLQIKDPTNPEICYTSASPWILLHKLLLWQETEAGPEDKAEAPGVVDLEPELPGSLSLLISAHTYLGQKSCCTMDHGRLLGYIVDIFVPIVTFDPSDRVYRLPVYSVEQIKAALDQALYCLYSHPSKKSSKARHLVDHNISQVALKYERALILFNYVKPVKLPEHDDVKTLSISADTDSLLRRIVALIPDTIAIEKRKGIAMDYLTGVTSKMKKLKKLENLPHETRDLFYLLADYAFKSNSDMENAISYYAIDLTFNRERFDSWAALALAQGSKLDSKLNSCHLIQPPKMLTEIESVEMCYRECLRINGSNANLWIEFGNFCYSIHSYITRTLDNNAEDLNFEVFEKLERKKEQFLKMAMDNYEKTFEIFERDGLNENDVDERWLLIFMIGKIKEKQGRPLLSSLECYQKSIGYLRKNKVVIPRKINYNNPAEFSIEALEVYYRIHASILKNIAKAEREKKIIPEETCRQYYEIIKTTQLDPIYNGSSSKQKSNRFSNKRKMANKADDGNAAKMTRADETSTTIMRDVVEVVDSMIDEIEFINDVTKFSMENLARLCILALEDVVFHFFHHFKALYRMAHFLHNTTSKLANPAKVRQLLLAGLTDKSAQSPGLFGGRKVNMIFNEVWRIPVNEIDRPGSFAAHCAKSLILLIDVLKSIPDVGLLVDISAQLRKPPSEENKFLQESDRQEIVTMAGTYLNTALKTIRDRMDVDKERKKPLETLEIFKLYQKMSKSHPGKEKEIFSSLKEMYAMIKNRTEDRDKITEAEVIRFCNSETARLRALANPKTPVTSSIAASSASTVTSSGAGASKGMVTASGDNTMAREMASMGSGTMAALQQWGQILADQQRMVQFNSLLAMSSALPNMTPKDIAAFCGLQESDLVNLAAYTSTIASLSPASLASFGITSSHLSQLAQIASLTGASQTQMASQAAKQAQFEQDVLRSYIGGAASAALTSMSSKPQTTTSAKTTSQTKPLPVKQTAQFKAKQQTNTSAAAVKKSVSKVMNLTGSTKPSAASATASTAKLNISQPPASKPASASKAPPATIGTASLTSVAAKLSHSGVTLSKPDKIPTGTGSARNSPSPVVVGKSSSAASGQSKDNPQQMSKKFPYLNITQLSTSPSSSPKPLLSVKPSSQLLKPGAMTNMSSSKAASNAAAAAGNSKHGANTSKMTPADAKNKLAMFKAQMKKQLNIPGSKTKPSPAANTASCAQRASSATMSRPSSSPSVSRPASSASKPSPASSASRPASSSSGAPRPGGQGSGMVKVTPGSTSAKTTAAQPTKKPDQGAAKPASKPSDQEVICIDID